jgi:uncharacterized protein (DUF885 family)
MRAAATIALLLALAPVVPVHGQGSPSSNAPFRETEPLPPLGALQAATSSTLSDAVSRYATDRATLMRRYDLPYSAVRRDRMREFYDGWTARLGQLDFDALDHESRIDHVLLRNEIAYQRGLLDREERIAGEMAPLLPFAEELVNLQASRRDLQPLDARAAANALARIAAQVDTARLGAEAGVAQAAGAAQRSAQRTPAGSNAAGGGTPIPMTRIVAFRTAGAVNELRQTLQRWYRFYAGYDPLFTWWAAEPYQRADEALESYNRSLRERVVGIRPGEEDPIIGDPIGADGLRADLQYELIPYSAAELVSIAEREFEWCEAEMRRASNELGFGNDWLAAIEHVKMQHVEPGRQAELTRMLAEEAIEFVESRDLLTVPPLAREVWRMEMLSAQQQRVAPFFLGGEMVQVAFPTDEMSHEDKLMAMRGNNIHFSRAVVHHELIPGHHLQQFMTNRYNPHRRAFSTPFWTEGWALYWEMLLWDLGFPQTAEDRVGMLFWRMHRAARIIFSLNVHLGAMTPDQAIDFLVERVGHERANATAEVRRSLIGTYPPLYQAAYMVGGLQFRALHQELVGSGRMTNREFHDRILQGGVMPVEMVRARLIGELLVREFETSWRFGG